MNSFFAKAINIFHALPLPIKIFVSLVGIIMILEQGSRFQWWKFQQDVKSNTTPHKQTVDVTKVPAEVKAFLSDEDLQKMDEAGMNIYTGDNPPNIEGTYIYKDIVIKYDPNGYNFPIITMNYIFKDQKDDNTVLFSSRGVKEDGSNDKSYTSEGKGVFISGEGNCFSVYLDNDEKMGQCESKSVEIFSACKDKKGLVDMDQGTLWTYMSDKCPKEEFVPAGYIRIFSHKSLAPKTN